MFQSHVQQSNLIILLKLATSGEETSALPDDVASGAAGEVDRVWEC